MKIAVIGSGISGMGAALALDGDHEVHLFERDARFGGHANTVEARFGARTVPVDTGFIVYNTKNYPNLTGLFTHLSVPTKWSDMSFGLSMDGGRMEYGCDNLDQLFAQRLNLLRPSFLRGMLEILRFSRAAPQQLASGALDGLTLGDYITREGFSPWFRDCFVLAFGGAIWSMPTAQVLDFPAESFVSFFHNHGLLTGLSPAFSWRTVEGGSREYVSRLIARLGRRAHAGQGVAAIRRAGGQVLLRFEDGEEARFDQVVLATHAPQARALLSDADAEERDVLGAFRTSRNRAVLHSDAGLMPRRRKVWSSWNFLCGRDPARDPRPAAVTYWMNRLQSIDPAFPLFVSLNPARDPAEGTVHGEFSYAHPIYDAPSFIAQTRLGEVQGRGGVWYAGAWTGYGFHEDGLNSGLRVAASLGAQPAWAPSMPDPWQVRRLEAAE